MTDIDIEKLADAIARHLTLKITSIELTDEIQDQLEDACSEILRNALRRMLTKLGGALTDITSEI